MRALRHEIVFGFDPGLANAGMAALVYSDRASQSPAKIRYRGFDSTNADCDAARAATLSRCVFAFIEDVRGEFPDAHIAACASEDVLRAGRFQREKMGMAFAAMAIGCDRAIPEIVIGSGWFALNPRSIKSHACPHWHGFSKDNWKAAGLGGKFERSMPDKQSMREAFERRFRIFGVDSEHVIDAAMAASLAREKMCGVPSCAAQLA